jgi:hypothetical protein
MVHALPDWLFVAALALGGVAWFRYYVWSDGTVARRSRSPLWFGFTATAASALFVVAGLAGFDLDRHSSFVHGSPWSDGVIWWEVLTGLAIAPIAILLVRRGMRDLQAEIRAERADPTHV